MTLKQTSGTQTRTNPIYHTVPHCTTLYHTLFSLTPRSVDSALMMEEGNVLFNDTLNTFYLRLYGVGHMVKDHSDSERGNPLLPHGLLFLINSKGSFICTIPDRIAHTTAFVTPVVEHWRLNDELN